MMRHIFHILNFPVALRGHLVTRRGPDLACGAELVHHCSRVLDKLVKFFSGLLFMAHPIEQMF